MMVQYMENIKSPEIEIYNENFKNEEVTLVVDTGYLPLIPTESGIYLGEALVSVNEEMARVFTTNTTNQEVEITIPPVELLDYTEVELGKRAQKKMKQMKKELKN
ncbi:uncharacterized protein LOC127279871 [Leptopilina boulardi]|uniref:uncharacterized protein LOC127279871 n=1 Tax=Leptopilina boulardi TaxID=63433 RepID=UPI0021F504AE|nr:uncharacterized protein LOC127279871 [Leptopilina boulardi]